MKFYCKKCQYKFDEDYESLFDHLKCPNCKWADNVLYFIVQGVHPPEDGLSITFHDFEEILERDKVKDLKEFFKEEFNLQFSRAGEDYTLLDENNKEVGLTEIFEKTQKDGKLQRMIYNCHYVLNH